MGYIPFYRGFKINPNRWADGSRTERGQQGNNKDKEKEIKAAKPSITNMRKDVSDLYRPLYDKGFSDYMKWYQNNAIALQDPSNIGAYAKAHAQQEMFRNQLESFIDWSQDEIKEHNKYYGKLEAWELGDSENGTDPNRLENRYNYVNANTYQNRFMQDGVMDELLYKDFMGWGFGRIDVDGVRKGKRPAIIDNPIMIETESGIQEIDYDNPDNWVRDDEGYFLDDNGKRMIEYVKSPLLDDGFEPYSDDNSITKLDYTKSFVLDFDSGSGGKYSSDNWIFTPRGVYVNTGDGFIDYREINGGNPEFSFRNKEYLKKQSTENPFSVWANWFWKTTNGAQGKITLDYKQNALTQLLADLDADQFEDGAGIASEYGKEMRSKIAMRLVESSGRNKGYIDKLMKSFGSGPDEMLIGGTSTSKNVISIGEQEFGRIKKFYEKSLGREIGDTITFTEYAAYESYKEAEKFWIEYQDMEAGGDGHFYGVLFDDEWRTANFWTPGETYSDDPVMNTYVATGGGKLGKGTSDSVLFEMNQSSLKNAIMTSRHSTRITMEDLYGINAKVRRTGPKRVITNTNGKILTQAQIKQLQDGGFGVESNWFVPVTINIKEDLDKDSVLRLLGYDLTNMSENEINRTFANAAEEQWLKEEISFLVPIWTESPWSRISNGADPLELPMTGIYSVNMVESLIEDTQAWKNSSNSEGITELNY
tara:strand:- start:628 stop:2742 length:2115 start_codon:yes stop_codon:yes gene_type:complete